MPWVTINGNHVLIGEENSGLGGGHDGTHNPATSTGNTHADSAVKFTGQSSKQKLDAWMKEHGATERKITETKDVTLPGGKVLPGRKLTRVVYDLKNGQVVKTDVQVVSDQVSGGSSHVYTVTKVK